MKLCFQNFLSTMKKERKQRKSIVNLIKVHFLFFKKHFFKINLLYTKVNIVKNYVAFALVLKKKTNTVVALIV